MTAEFPHKEWKESLGTKDLEEAKRRLRRRALETDQEIGLGRARLAGRVPAPLAQAEAQELANAQLAAWLAEDEQRRLEAGPRAARRGLEPKFKLLLGATTDPKTATLPLEDVVSSIILGPNCASDLMLKSAHRMAQPAGKPDLAPRICVSGIPYRSNA